MNRAERRWRTANIVARRQWQLDWIFPEGDAAPKVVGRCRTMAPFDCGRPRCGLCSLIKRKWAGPTRAEMQAYLSFREDLLEEV